MPVCIGMKYECEFNQQLIQFKINSKEKRDESKIIDLMSQTLKIWMSSSQPQLSPHHELFKNQRYVHHGNSIYPIHFSHDHLKQRNESCAMTEQICSNKLEFTSHVFCCKTYIEETDNYRHDSLWKSMMMRPMFSFLLWKEMV